MTGKGILPRRGETKYLLYRESFVSPMCMRRSRRTESTVRRWIASKRSSWCVKKEEINLIRPFWTRFSKFLSGALFHQSVVISDEAKYPEDPVGEFQRLARPVNDVVELTDIFKVLSGLTDTYRVSFCHLGNVYSGNKRKTNRHSIWFQPRHYFGSVTAVKLFDWKLF